MSSIQKKLGENREKGNGEKSASPMFTLFGWIPVVLYGVNTISHFLYFILIEFLKYILLFKV